MAAVREIFIGKCAGCEESGVELCGFPDSSVWVYCRDCHEEGGDHVPCDWCKCDACQRIGHLEGLLQRVLDTHGYTSSEVEDLHDDIRGVLGQEVESDS